MGSGIGGRIGLTATVGRCQNLTSDRGVRGSLRFVRVAAKHDTLRKGEKEWRSTLV